MDRANHGLAAFLRNALLGAICGAAIGFAVGFVLSKLAPARFEAAIILYHMPGSGLSDSGRDFVASTLADEEFQQGLINHEGWDVATGQELIKNLSVSAEDASRPIAELRLVGSRQKNLPKSLKLIAEELVAFSRTRQQKTMQSHLDKIENAASTASANREKLAAAMSMNALSESAQNAIDVATKLARQRRELELLLRHRLRGASAQDELQRQQRMDAVRKLEQGHAQTLTENAEADPSGFEQALNIALADIEVLVLEQAQERLQKEFLSAKPLQILRRDKAATEAKADIPIVLATVFGGIVGMLLGGIFWSLRRPPPRGLSSKLVQQILRIPLLGVMDATLTDFGERERRPLAESNPDNIAVAALHSLRVGLGILEKARQSGAALAFTGPSTPPHLSHLVANLAVVAAQAGEQILLIEIGSSPTQLASLVAGEGSGVNYIYSDTVAGLAERVSQFPSGSSTDGFVRTIIQADAAVSAHEALKYFGGGLGIFVCDRAARLPLIRKAGAKSLHGLVVCGHHIDESAYYDSSEST